MPQIHPGHPWTWSPMAGPPRPKALRLPKSINAAKRNENLGTQRNWYTTVCGSIPQNSQKVQTTQMPILE